MTPPDVEYLPCQCEAKACIRGGRCHNPITEEDLLCDYCRIRGLHCHIHPNPTPDCLFVGITDVSSPLPKPPLDPEL